MIFKKSGRLPNNTVFNLDNVEIEIVKNFTYLGIVFSTGGSFSEAQSALSGQVELYFTNIFHPSVLNLI